MPKFLFSVAILLMVFVSSCKKEKKEPEVQIPQNPNPPQVSVPDTIKPGSYFPAFPGSFWKYVSSNGDTNTSSTSLSYQLDAYVLCQKNLQNSGIDTSYKSPKRYVAFYDKVPIWGKFKHVPSIDPCLYSHYPMEFIISDSVNVGSKWEIEPYLCNSTHTSFGTIATVVARDVTVQINGTNYFPIIVVNYDRCVYLSSGPSVISHYKTYYAKNIGIVKIEEFQGSSSILINEKLLVSYFVNN